MKIPRTPAWLERERICPSTDFISRTEAVKGPLVIKRGRIVAGFEDALRSGRMSQAQYLGVYMKDNKVWITHRLNYDPGYKLSYWKLRNPQVMALRVIEPVALRKMGTSRPKPRRTSTLKRLFKAFRSRIK